MSTPAPATADEAADMVLAGLGYLASMDPTSPTADAQARCLQVLEHGDAVSTAAGPGFSVRSPLPRDIPITPTTAQRPG
jgi:hypothetical protein